MICVTNRLEAVGDFYERIAIIARYKARSIILREKDLTPLEYEKLAKNCLEVLGENRHKLIIHSHVEVAKRLGIRKVHMPFKSFLQAEYLEHFEEVGVSVHTVEEAIEAERKGAAYLIVGHIFPTACKSGMSARGIAFVEKVCEAVGIPVYPIGGIEGKRVEDVLKAGASDTCAMSSLMCCSLIKADI